MVGGYPQLFGYPEPAASHPWLAMPATAFVVASNAPQAVRDGARSQRVLLGFTHRARIQICDGVDDQVEIQAAIDALPAGGGTILLLEGTYTCSAVTTQYSILINKNNVHLTGQGSGTVIKVKDSFGDANKMLLHLLNANYCSVTNMAFDGNRTNNPTSHIEGIYLDGTSCYNLVQGIWGYNFTDDAVELEGNPSYNIVCDSFFWGCITSGVSLNDRAGAVLERNIIRNNQIWNNVGVEARSIVFTGEAGGIAQFNQIIGNICHNNAGNHGGIELASPGSMIRNIIDGNIVTNSAQDGIFLGPTATYNVIQNNVCYNNRQHGIYLQQANYNIIKDNYCADNNQAAGAYYDIFAWQANYLTVVNNKAKGEIRLNPTVDSYVVGNDCAILTVVDNGTFGYVEGNTGQSHGKERIVHRSTNGSGVQMVLGNVITYRADTFGSPAAYFGKTTTKGDPKVLGMVLETVAHNASGRILTVGYTNALKVNGIADIAQGDLLCTYTEAGIACKAAAGDTAFAIAISAYATDDSNGVIEALLITPRKL